MLDPLSMSDFRLEKVHTSACAVSTPLIQMLGKDFCLVRMANQAKGQARVFAFLARGKLSHHSTKDTVPYYVEC